MENGTNLAFDFEGSVYFGDRNKPIDCPTFYISGVSKDAHPIVSKTYGEPPKIYNYKKLRREIFARR